MVKPRTRWASAGLAAAILMIAVAPAWAVTPEEAATSARDGLFVEPGADPVDTDRLAAVLVDAANTDLDLTVAVLAGTVEAVDFADSLSQITEGTALVFTANAYGAASRVLSQSELDRVLSDARSRLEGTDVAAGVAAFVDAAQPSGVNWPLLLAAALVVLIVVAIVGRRIERRSTAGRRQAALEKSWRALESRADAMADPVLELSTPVELDGRQELAEQYRAAASQYGYVRDALMKAPHAGSVDRIGNDLTELERAIASLRRALDRSVE